MTYWGLEASDTERILHSQFVVLVVVRFFDEAAGGDEVEFQREKEC